MITRTTGDILQADTEAVVNTVNCVGVMGRGIALQFKKRYPENFAEYERVCEDGALVPGRMLVHERGSFINPRFIINFPTKKHWRDDSDLADIRSGLRALVNEVVKRGITSIAVPPLGCGLGGLDWKEVRPLIESAFADVAGRVQVVIYEPAGAPAAKAMATTKAIPQMTVGRAALIGLMRRYLSAVMDPSVTLLELHKLMYFMQEAGEPLKLKYAKAKYGPYAENLRHVLSAIEGHWVSGYADGADQPEKELEILPGAVESAERFLADHPRTRDRFEAVGRLISGFESPYGMELLATVHWVAKHDGASTAEKVVEKTHAWGTRKKMFPTDHIERAWDVLKNRGALT